MGKRKWTANDAMVPFVANTPLITLADATVLTGALTNASDNEYRALSVRGTWAMRAVTAGEGPIMVGVAHADYTVTEIKECIEAEAAMSRGDKIAREQADRLVRRIGTFANESTDEVLNDGKPITTRLNWVIADGSQINLWAYNQSGATLTTGAVVSINGKIRLRWI